jgi:hypothetical protein
MKKTLKSFCAIYALIFAVVIMFPPLDVYAQNPRIRIDGEFIQIPTDEQQPVIVNGRTLVPLRVVMETLGFNVEWDAPTQTVSLEKTGYCVIFKINNNDMLVNNSTISLDIPAQIMSDRTMVPLRAISEATGMIVLWDSTNFIVDILSDDNAQISIVTNREIISEENWPEHLPRHVQGSISLRPDIFLLGLIEPFTNVDYRYAFYVIEGYFFDLVDANEFDEWVEEKDSGNIETMFLMRFVQHFDISREEFDDAEERMREDFRRRNRDLTDEYYEIPNADIIYTFDNDIIRHYYRRE